MEAVPPGLPADLRNILIRNQQMELRWQRQFADRLRNAGDERPGASSRSADPRRQAEQQWTAQQAQLAQQKRAEEQRIEARRRELAELQEAEQRARQQRLAAQAAASQQQAARKGRGWGDSNRRIGSYGDD